MLALVVILVQVLDTYHDKQSIETKVVNTVPVPIVPAGMYHTNIETLTFRIGLNTGRIGHVPATPANFGQHQQVPGVPTCIEKSVFFF